MLNNKKLINYLIVRENNVNSYLKNFDITKDDFNSLFINNKDELARYYDEAYNRAVTKVMDDEYVGITFDNLEKINTAQKIIENIKNNEIESEITSIDVSNTNDFCVIMQGEGKKIHLGNASNINDKILMLKEILTKEKGKTGEIFIENLEKVYFREASWIE